MHGSSAARAARRPTPLAVPPPPHRTRENTRPRQSREEERLGPRAEAASAPADRGAEAPKPAGKSRERLGGEVKTGRQERVGNCHGPYPMLSTEFTKVNKAQSHRELIVKKGSPVIIS